MAAAPTSAAFDLLRQTADDGSNLESHRERRDGVPAVALPRCRVRLAGNSIAIRQTFQLGLASVRCAKHRLCSAKLIANRLRTALISACSAEYLASLQSTTQSLIVRWFYIWTESSREEGGCYSEGRSSRSSPYGGLCVLCGCGRAVGDRAGGGCGRELVQCKNRQSSLFIVDNLDLAPR